MENSKDKAIVNFIGVGVQKCGTSWLYEMLREHPEIQLSEVKELDFFTKHYDKGYYWYHKQIEHNSRAVIHGEFSTSYFYSMDTIERIKRYNPDVKILIIVRDPMKRIFSNYLHELRQEHISSNTPFLDALKENPCYIEQCLFHKYIKRWRDNFGYQNIKLVSFEKLRENPSDVVRDIYKFLAVDTNYAPTRIHEKVNQSVEIRSKFADQISSGIGIVLRSVISESNIHKIKTLSPIKIIRDLYRKDMKNLHPSLTPTEKALILENEELRNDIIQMAQMDSQIVNQWEAYELLDPQ